MECGGFWKKLASELNKQCRICEGRVNLSKFFTKTGSFEVWSSGVLGMWKRQWGNMREWVVAGEENYSVMFGTQRKVEGPDHYSKECCPRI